MLRKLILRQKKSFSYKKSVYLWRYLYLNRRSPAKACLYYYFDDFTFLIQNLLVLWSDIVTLREKENKL